MKKIISLVLSTVLLLGLSAGVSAEEKEDVTKSGGRLDHYWIARVAYDDMERGVFQALDTLAAERKNPGKEDAVEYALLLLEDEDENLAALTTFRFLPDGEIETKTLALDEDYVLEKEEGSLRTAGGPETSDGAVVFETEDYTITITGYEVLAPGEGANQYNKDPAIQFTYSVRVPEGRKSTTASMAWALSTTIIQDNDPNKVNVLDEAFLSETSFKDALADIKPGGTVTSSSAYLLTDIETPVTIEFKENIFSSAPDKVVDFPIKSIG